VDVTENSFAERLRLNGEGPTLEHGVVGAAGECAEGILKYVHEGIILQQQLEHYERH
jgi:hypothetical protein